MAVGAAYLLLPWFMIVDESDGCQVFLAPRIFDEVWRRRAHVQKSLSWTLSARAPYYICTLEQRGMCVIA